MQKVIVIYVIRSAQSEMEVFFQLQVKNQLIAIEFFIIYPIQK